MNEMHDFLGNHNVIISAMAWNKAILKRTNEVHKKGPKEVDQNLGDDFV